MGGTSRGKFSSSFGFVMAAAGSAVGLGNIWSFPIRTAQNGGAVFVLLYIIFAFIIGYPVLLAEFTLGRYTRSNPVGAYRKVKGGKPFVFIGFLSLITVMLIFSFYSIIAGAMIAYFVEPIFRVIGLEQVAFWMTSQSVLARVIFSSLFFILTVLIVVAGVSQGIEKWSTRLMPTLLVVMVLLIGYVLTLPGATEGLSRYLVPDFGKVFDPKIFIEAMGQAFFSLSLGVGSMLVYASYLGKKENLFRLSTLVTFSDVGIAFLAGLLIIPALYVSAHTGTPIFDEAGRLISGPDLVFSTLPSLFNTMGYIGIVVAVVFFFLLVIASLTSTISMLEVPVAFLVDEYAIGRTRSGIIIGLLCWVVSMLIVLNYDSIFMMVVTLTTQYLQPLMGLLLCLFVGWVINRNELVKELTNEVPVLRRSFFIKVWSFFVKVVSPVLILIVIINSFLI